MREFSMKRYFIVLVLCAVVQLIAPAGCKKEKSVIVLDAGRGADFGAQLAAAIQNCLPGACYIDARQITGAQTAAESIVIDRGSLTIDVAFSDLTFAPGANWQIHANHVTLEGPPTATSTIRCGTGAACVYIGSASPAYSTTLANLRIEPVAGTSPRAGIELRNARGPGSFLRNVFVTGFNAAGAAALRFDESDWTWTVEDSTFTMSNHGIELDGDQDNAIVFQRNLITLNTHEGVWIALCNHPTVDAGCTTGGITFSDGNHFEGNAGPGIRLVNGSIYNLDIRDSYAEMTKANTGYVLAENDGTPNAQLRVVGMLVDGGGGYISGGMPLNILDTTKGYRYGEPPIAISAVTCADGACTVTTKTAHGFTCSPIDNYALCPFVHIRTSRNVFDMDARITGILDGTHFKFHLNGTSNDTGGMVEYAPDRINAIVSNQKWRTSWTAPAMVSVIGNTVTLATANNSVVDGKGFVIQDAAGKPRQGR